MLPNDNGDDDNDNDSVFKIVRGLDVHTTDLQTEPVQIGSEEMMMMKIRSLQKRPSCPQIL